MFLSSYSLLPTSHIEDGCRSEWRNDMGADFYAKTILITGAAGPLGRALSRRLLQNGYRVRILVRDPQKVTRLAEHGAQVVQGDLTDADSLKAAVQGSHFVFHLAGISDPQASKSQIEQANVTGTRHLAEAALREGLDRFIYVSCTQVYGFPRHGNIDEYKPLKPCENPYINSKVQAELLLREMASRSGFPLVIAQLSMVYGPEMEAWTIQPLRKLAAGKLVLPGNGEGLLHPLYLDDAVEGILSAGVSGENGEAYILCGPEVVLVRDFFGHYARMLGKEDIPTLSTSQAMREATMAEWAARLSSKPPEKTRLEVQRLTMKHSCNGGKAYYNLEFVPAVKLDEGMVLIQEWLQKHIDARKGQRTASERSDYSSSNPPAGL
jgi:nucleoside-diphosphate-sugar epimerase